jgi:hypothetical protein
MTLVVNTLIELSRHEPALAFKDDQDAFDRTQWNAKNHLDE